MFNAGIGSGNIGGTIGRNLRLSGYDHLVLEGRARDPVYLFVDESGVQFLDARHLWGKPIDEVDEVLRNEHGSDVALLYIGPAGENLVRSAAIVSNKYRTQGRCGLGLILGAMRVKAIVIPNASGKMKLGNLHLFNETVKRMLEKINSKPEIVEMLSNGLASTMDIWLGLLNPVRNFQDGYLDPEEQQALSGESYAKYATKNPDPKRCPTCPVQCNAVYSVPDGPYKGTTWSGVEGDVQWDFGARLGIIDVGATIMLHALCTKLGLDVDSVSGVIAWAFESYQRGVLTEADTDGLQLEWGNLEVVKELLYRIAAREGVGNLLAEGSLKAAATVGQGSEAWAIHIKGQDNAEPLRAEKGWALGCGVSPRGGGHTRGAPMPNCTPPMPDPYDPTSYDGQAERVVRTERLHAMLDCLGLCNIPSQWLNEAYPGPEDYALLFSAAEDAVMIEKIYNQVNAGFDRSDDYPPARFMQEPLPRGPMKGQVLEREKWDQMLDEYYCLHNWDPVTGKIPASEVHRILDSACGLVPMLR
jgi:aldehyde:ferredoxin oxidoreductase